MSRIKACLTSMSLTLFLIFAANSAKSASYEFRVDHVLLHQGASDWPLDFEGGPALDDGWELEAGTAELSDGFLVLKSPGEDNYFYQGSLFVSQERSAVSAVMPEEFVTTEGSGSFVLDSQWEQVIPEENFGFGMSFHYPPSETDKIRVGFDNYSAEMLSLLGAPDGTPAGSYITFIQLSPTPGPHLFDLTFNTQVVPVSPEQVTGDIVFRLTYDDSTNSFSGAYSLDGGTLFNSPFSPFAISSLDGQIEPFAEFEAGYLTAGPPIGLADAPWPMFQQNASHTGQSDYAGPTNNTLKWRFPLLDGVVAAGPIIGPDGTVYICNTGRVYAINDDGSLKWSTDVHLGGSGSSTLAISSDGTLYAPFYKTLYALNTDGSGKWQYTSPLEMVSSPSIGENVIYIGSGLDLLAINLDGTMKWSYRIGEEARHSPAISTDGTVYMRGREQYLVAVNPDGTEKWTRDLGSTESHTNMSPTIGPDGTIYTFGEMDDGNPYTPPTSMTSGLYAINPGDGSTKWVYPDISISHGIQMTPAVDRSGNIYHAGKEIGESNRDVLFALNSLGDLLWTFELPEGLYFSNSSPSIDSDGIIYFGTNGNKLFALNPDGTPKWEFEALNDINSSPALGDNHSIYFGSSDGHLYAIGWKTIDLPGTISILRAMSGINTDGIDLGTDISGDGKIGLAEAIYRLQILSQ